MFSLFVSATPVCFSGESCTLYATCKNNTYVESSALISIYYPNTSILSANKSMTQFAEGQFNYTFIAPDITGNYLHKVRCNISNVIGVAEDEFTIGENKMIADQIYNMGEILFLVFIFMIHFVLMYIALSRRQIILLGISGIAGLIASITGIVNVGMVTAFGSLMTIFFSGYALISAGLIGWTAWLYEQDNN